MIDYDLPSELVGLVPEDIRCVSLSLLKEKTKIWRTIVLLALYEIIRQNIWYRTNVIYGTYICYKYGLVMDEERGGIMMGADSWKLAILWLKWRCGCAELKTELRQDMGAG